MIAKSWLFLCFLWVTCYLNSQVSNSISYDFSCMESGDDWSWLINISSDIEKDVLNSYGAPVTLQEEKVVGDSTLRQMKLDYVVIQSGDKYLKCKAILGRLVQKLNAPRGFTYQIYLLESEELNAFTVGGKIFFTTGMYDFCVSDDERACIIGHEIAHNELGHINENLSRMKTAGEFGAVGQISASIGTLMTTSFNQKNETHCDFVGIDLAQAAGFKGCASVQLWQRMMNEEGGQVELQEFFSSHPYSGKRSDCSKQHLEVNYSIECSNN
jgi:predicted Zn-dependent protease